MCSQDIDNRLLEHTSDTDAQQNKTSVSVSLHSLQNAQFRFYQIRKNDYSPLGIRRHCA